MATSSVVRCGDAAVPSSADGLLSWLTMRALPLWTTLGRDEDGRFAEALTVDGRDPTDFHRARVPARQLYVLARAGRMGWRGPWRSLLQAGLERYWLEFGRPEGDFRTRLTADGAALDDTAYLYDQAFALLAMASAASVGVAQAECSARAARLRDRLEVSRVTAGGWREAGERPFQANAQMHLLEACLAWEDVEPSGPWRAMADEIVDLALTRFIDPATGALREFFTGDWSSPPQGEAHLIEPGHQFEWAWLLVRHARSRSAAPSLAAARRLYLCGAKGILAGREVICDELNADLTLRSTRARLWPQTEWLKAALILSEVDPQNPAFAADAARARTALSRYLLDDGRWHDKQMDDGSFLDEPAPAQRALVRGKQVEKGCLSPGRRHVTLPPNGRTPRG